MRNPYPTLLSLAGLVAGAAYGILTILELTGRLAEGPWPMIALAAFVVFWAIKLLIHHRLKQQNITK
jgi:hypothetical protein